MADELFWIAALFSVVIGTMAGFGSSTIFLPIALFFFEFKSALIFVAILHISGNIGRITFFRHGLDRKILLVFGIPSVLLTIVGALLVNYSPQPLLKLILGLFLIIYVFISLNEDFSVKPTTRNSILGGSLSGFFAGLIGTGGAIRGAFLTSFKLEKSVYISTAAFISLAVDLTRIPIYLGSGFLPTDLIYFIPLLFVIAIAGSFIGKRIVQKVPHGVFRRIVLLAISLAGLKFIYEGIAYFL